MAGESHMEETCAPEAVPNCMRQTGTIAVRVSIPVCSQSDSKAWRRQPNAACRQVSDPTLDFPYAIALPIKGAGEVSLGHRPISGMTRSVVRQLRPLKRERHR